MEPSTWERALVYFGFRYEGPPPTDLDLKVFLIRRIAALGCLIVMLVILALAAFPS